MRIQRLIWRNIRALEPFADKRPGHRAKLEAAGHKYVCTGDFVDNDDRCVVNKYRSPQLQVVAATGSSFKRAQAASSSLQPPPATTPNGLLLFRGLLAASRLSACVCACVLADAAQLLSGRDYSNSLRVFGAHGDWESSVGRKQSSGAHDASSSPCNRTDTWRGTKACRVGVGVAARGGDPRLSLSMSEGISPNVRCSVALFIGLTVATVDAGSFAHSSDRPARLGFAGGAGRGFGFAAPPLFGAVANSRRTAVTRMPLRAQLATNAKNGANLDAIVGSTILGISGVLQQAQKLVERKESDFDCPGIFPDAASAVVAAYASPSDERTAILDDAPSMLVDSVLHGAPLGHGIRCFSKLSSQRSIPYDGQLRQVVDKIHDAALDSLLPGGGAKVLDFTYEEIMQVLHNPLTLTLHLPEPYTPPPCAHIP